MRRNIAAKGSFWLPMLSTGIRRRTPLRLAAASMSSPVMSEMHVGTTNTTPGDGAGVASGGVSAAGS
jgi:hypothetical protein